MRPAFDVPVADVLRGFPEVVDLLNRAGFLTRTVMVRVGGAFYVDTDATVTTWRNVYWPIDAGTVARYARLIPSTTRTKTTGSYIKIALGLRNGSQFDVLGTEYDSRTHDLSEGVPFELLTEEASIPSDSGLVVRVTQFSWPAIALLESDVETSLGYEGV